MDTETNDPREPLSVLNVVLGGWLFISAFIWTHTTAQMTNTSVVGGLCAVLSALAMGGHSRARYLTMPLAIWLFLSSWAIPTVDQRTEWNNVLVAIAIFVVSLLLSGEEDLQSRPQTH
jgi:hypothetical protein